MTVGDGFPSLCLPLPVPQFPHLQNRKGSAFCVHQSPSRTWPGNLHFILSKQHRELLLCLVFADEEADAQRGEITHPSHAAPGLSELIAHDPTPPLRVHSQCPLRLRDHWAPTTQNLRKGALASKGHKPYPGSHQARCHVGRAPLGRVSCVWCKAITQPNGAKVPKTHVFTNQPPPSQAAALGGCETQPGKQAGSGAGTGTIQATEAKS